MKNLNKLLSILPEIGWGDAMEYKGTIGDIAKCHTVVSSGISLTLKRAAHRADCKNKGISPLPFLEWRESMKNEKSFDGYMLNNYPMKEGDFVLDITLEELDVLAGKFLEFKTSKNLPTNINN